MQVGFTFLAVRIGFVAVLLCALIGAVSPSAQAEGACPNEALRQELQSGRLPDCRAYEMVTPPHKGGVPAYLTAVSPDGSSVIVQSKGNFGDAESNQTVDGATYELTRASTGWSEADIDPPALQYPWDSFRDATPDLGATLWKVRSSSQSLYAEDLLIREADGTLHDLGPDVNPAGTVGPPGLGLPPGQVGFSSEYVGASADLSHVLFWVATEESAAKEVAAPKLWPGDTTAAAVPLRHSLYERVGDASFEPTLVGVSNEGPLDGSPHINEGAVLFSECGTNLGSPRGGNTRNAISESGATVFFTAEHDAGCAATQPAVNELYARVDGVKTVAISEPPLSGAGAVPGRECTGVCATDEEVPGDRSEGIFVGASRNGSKVFFLTKQPLLNGDEDATTDLYEAEIEGEGADAHLSRLVQVSHDPNAGQTAEVEGVTRVSEDGSHVYFVARGVLASNSNGQPGYAGAYSKAQEDAENLYVYGPDPASPGHYQTVFVAMLCSEADESGLVSDSECNSSDERMWSVEGNQATPDGDFLVFSTATDLTAPEDISSVNQVFRYDAETGELVRVSIGQDGFNANGNTNAFAAGLAQSSGPNAGISPVTVSTDGSVVFQSPDGLTSRALNGQEESFEYETEENTRSEGTFYANNVYEWEADGTEANGGVSCGESAGCVSLISDGLDTTGTSNGSTVISSVALAGETPSGGDIFFTTADHTDTQQDIYDARIDGGFPPPPAPVPCEESCQGAPGSQPLFGTPSSTTFAGPGNIAPPPAPAPVKPKTAAQIKAEQLAKALKACKKDKKKAKRTKCEKQAHRQFGTAKQAKRASNDRRAK